MVGGLACGKVSSGRPGVWEGLVSGMVSGERPGVWEG